MAILYALIILIIMILIYRVPTENTLPTIVRYKFASSPIVVILAGSHGNEYGPSVALQSISPGGWIPADYYIVPYVNIDAATTKTRSAPGQKDINRLWPGGTNINRYLLPLISNADLIVDFHEAWGFHICQSQSLGQTIYTNATSLYGKLEKIISNLNRTNSDCSRWTLLNKLPPLNGTLDQLCNSAKIPYILVEMAGQSNVVPLCERVSTTKYILQQLFS